MVMTRISKLFTSGKTTVCIVVKRFFLLDKQHDRNRYFTCLRIGYPAKDKGPFKGGPNQNISVNCYCLPEEPYVFNNIPISNRLPAFR